ncbi:MAG TPA: MFS transporter, partial [Nitrolancea sp.]|nr:MFS transporter [Nitrolancea sp.]
IQTLWPLYIASLGASPSQVGLVLGAAGVMRLVALVPGGALADRFASKRFIAAGQAAMAIAFLGYAIVRTWWQLIPAELPFALGAATYPSILTKIAAISSDAADRTRRFTMINTIGPAVGLLLAPIAGGFIASQLSVRSVFIFAAILTVASTAMFANLSRDAEPHASEVTVSYWTTLHQPVILVWCLLEMIAIFSLTLGMALIPNYLHNFQGISDGVIGSFAALSAAGSIAIGLVVSRIPFFRHSLNGIGLALAAAAAAFILIIVGNELFTFIVAYVLLGGFFATWTLFESALGGVAARRYHARAYAIAEILSGVGNAVAPVLAGFLFEVDPRAPVIAGLFVTMLLILGLIIVTRLKLLSRMSGAHKAF